MQALIMLALIQAFKLPTELERVARLWPCASNA